MDFPLKHAQFSTFFISLVEANELQYSAGNESDLKLCLHGTGPERIRPDFRTG